MLFDGYVIRNVVLKCVSPKDVVVICVCKIVIHISNFYFHVKECGLKLLYRQGSDSKITVTQRPCS